MNTSVLYVLIILLALIIVLALLMKKFLRKCMKRFFWNSDVLQVHQPVALENMSNEFDINHNDLKLEDVSSYDKADEKDEKIDLNFEHIASDINTAKESKTSESPKETQKIEIEFSRVEDMSKIMGTEA